jgi:hypothetical protein
VKLRGLMILIIFKLLGPEGELIKREGTLVGYFYVRCCEEWISGGKAHEVGDCNGPGLLGRGGIGTGGNLDFQECH